MKRLFVIVVWACLLGLAFVLVCAGVTLAADWIVNAVIPWLAAEPDRQSIITLGALALIALAAAEAMK